jgi:hypothetical protein
MWSLIVTSGHCHGAGARDLPTTPLRSNVIAEEFDRLPKARSFQSIAVTAPSVNSGEVEGGFQVNDASGAENAFDSSSTN